MADNDGEPLDDRPTTIRALPALPGARPYTAPFRLERPSADPHADWLASLPAAARAVLEVAREQAESWPVAPRIAGAVALPVRRSKATPPYGFRRPSPQGR